MAAPTPLTLPSPAGRGTTIVLRTDLALRISVPTAAGTVTITATDAEGTELGTLATVDLSRDDRASATAVAAALAIAADSARALWPTA